MVSTTVGLGLVLLGAGLLLILVAIWASRRRSQARRRAEAPTPEPMVDEERTWSPDDVGPPLPGEGTYTRCVRELAALCYDELPLGRVREYWEADPAVEPGLEHPVLVEVEVDGAWHHIEPRYLGHRIDVQTLVTDLNRMLPEEGPRLVMLDGDPPRVGVARWQQLG